MLEALYPAMFAAALVMLMFALWEVVQGWRVKGSARDSRISRGCALFIVGMAIMAGLKYLTDF